MYVEPEILIIGDKKLVTSSASLSLANNTTPELWRRFMPLRKEIENAVGTDLFSVSEYPAGYFEHFDPAKEFIKRAGLEVNDFGSLPAGLETYLLEEGRYAVFHYKGLSGDPSIFRHIYTDWLPRSGYTLDHRPHFEVLGSRYRNGAQDSEEDIYIPLK